MVPPPTARMRAMVRLLIKEVCILPHLYHYLILLYHLAWPNSFGQRFGRRSIKRPFLPSDAGVEGGSTIVDMVLLLLLRIGPYKHNNPSDNIVGGRWFEFKGFLVYGNWRIMKNTPRRDNPTATIAESRNATISQPDQRYSIVFNMMLRLLMPRRRSITWIGWE